MGQASAEQVAERVEQVREWIATDPNLKGRQVGVLLGLSTTTGCQYLQRARLPIPAPPRQHPPHAATDDTAFWEQVKRSQTERHEARIG